MDPEFREALDQLEERLRRHIDGTADSLRAEIRSEIRAGDAETRRHAGVLNEALRADFRIATEGIDALNQKFDTRL